MSQTQERKSGTDFKVSLFRSFFTGLADVYGTYDPKTGKSWQVKKRVTDQIILSHLKGLRPYGVYLLDGCRTRALAVDFDTPDPFPPVEFINAARHYQLPAYLEKSKSKGFHVWIFFAGNGVQAEKARLVAKHILDEIEHPATEIFPKKDCLDKSLSYGNFINAPLFGKLVPKEKTVFIDPATMKPYPEQWPFLYSIERVDEKTLDDIIEINNLMISKIQKELLNDDPTSGSVYRFGLPPCAKKNVSRGGH